MIEAPSIRLEATGTSDFRSLDWGREIFSRDKFSKKLDEIVKMY